MHSECTKLLRAVGQSLGRSLPDSVLERRPGETLADLVRLDVVEAFGLASYYCARQVERVHKTQVRGHRLSSDFDAIRPAFDELNSLLKRNATDDDREGILHRLMDDFINQIEVLAPDQAPMR